MTNYINPFEKRTFSARFRAVFAFAKQNFVQVIKYDLILLMVIAALLAGWICVYPNSKINNLGSLANFVCFSYFTHYLLNRGEMSATSFKNMLRSTGGAFVKVFVASFLVLAILIPITIVFVIVGGIALKFNPVIGGLIFVLFGLLILYMTPILNIYYTHYYFSKKNNSSVEALKDSYLMIKGHWWSTFGLVFVIGLIGELIVVLISIPILILLPIFIGTFLSLTIAFIVFIFTLHAASIFQYGHLKALNKIGEKEECEEKYEFV